MMTRADLKRSAVEHAPSLRAIPFGTADAPGAARLLTRAQRQRLASIATRVRLRPRAVVYKEDTTAGWVYINATGVVKSFRDLPSGKRRVAAFLFPEDIFGLAENGRYVNTVEAITQVTLHRFPIDSLKQALLDDGELQFQFLCKVTHELRQAQRRNIALTRRDAVGRVAMFLSMLERQGTDTGVKPAIAVPMSRSDVANYLGLSLEAVSRATRELARRRIVAFADRHAARILDRASFERLVGAV